jgi:hypothetical protein
MFAGYKKTTTSKIIRVRHEVSYKIGFSAQSIKNSLSNVPDGAHLEDISDGNGVETLIFLEEKPDKDGPSDW